MNCGLYHVYSSRCWKPWSCKQSWQNETCTGGLRSPSRLCNYIIQKLSMNLWLFSLIIIFYSSESHWFLFFDERAFRDYKVSRSHFGAKSAFPFHYRLFELGWTTFLLSIISIMFIVRYTLLCFYHAFFSSLCQPIVQIKLTIV